MTMVILCWLDWSYPWLLRSCRRFMTSTVARVSRSPVGSSRSRMEGQLERERAMATLCCSPPDNSEGRWSPQSYNPTQKSNSILLSLISLSFKIPFIRIGSSTFSLALIVAIKLNDWNTNPILFYQIYTKSYLFNIFVY